MSKATNRSKIVFQSILILLLLIAFTASMVSAETATAPFLVEDDDTISLLHMNGPDGSQAFQDETGRMWTPVGNVQIDTAQSVFGGSSALFGGGYLKTPGTDFDFGSGDFTIDFWVKFNSLSGLQQFVAKRNGWDWAPIVIEIDATNVMFFSSANGSSWAADVQWAYGNNIITQTWYHFAFVRDGSNWCFYLDGNVKACDISSHTVMTNNIDFTIGASATGTHVVNGWMDEVRISKGVARWTSNFTRPTSEYIAATPTPAHTPSSDEAFTVAMLHMNGPDGGLVFHDETGKLWGAVGDAQLDTAQSKFGGSSALFDGSGDYLYTPDHPDFNFGSGDFTIDFWVRFNSLTGVQYFVGKRPDQSYAPFVLEIDNTYVYFFSDDNNTPWTWAVDARWAYGTNIVPGTWYHFAFVRNGSDWRFYLNGESKSFATSSHTVMTNTHGVTVGGIPNGDFPLDGWIDELRITKGVARWASNFTPPTSEYTVATPTPTATFTPTSTPTNTPTPTLIYDRTIAVDYADDWAHDRNIEYPMANEISCGCNDCTNYLSQVLHEGGYPLETGNWDENNPEEWWYRNDTYLQTDHSKTWSATDWFFMYVFFYSHHLEFTVINADPESNPVPDPEPELEAGDFILLDMRNNNNANDPTPDGKPDHARIVVGRGDISQNAEDYISLDKNDLGICVSTILPTPPATETLLINQHCIDRKHVAWDYNVPSHTGKVYIHVNDQ